jgi:deazaflavin-dependent oxidoreductase (nitroreductase family)
MSNKPSNGLKKIGRTANKLHVALYRKSGGKFAGRIANMPLMVITTYGRVTGKPTSNAVVYIQDGQDYLVSATNGGMDWTPGWYRNLKTHPQARIQVGEAVFDVRATILEGEERARRYEQFKAASENFIKYEQKASRLLPVIRLTPASGR